MELLSDGNGMAPSWSPDGARLAFLSNRAAGWDVYTMRADGSDVRRLTHGRSPEAPAWSPDGEWIAFVRADAVEVVRPDGSGGRVVVDGAAGGSTVAWSPDASQLCFVRDACLWLTPSDGDGEPVQLTQGGADGEPAWAPDGAPATPAPDGAPATPAPDGAPATPAPDGAPVVFVRQGALWQVEVGSGGERRLTESAVDASPAPAPDGASLALIRAGALAVRDGSTARIARVAGAPAPAGRPAWSPDGAWLAFHALLAGNWEVLRIRPAGSDLGSLTRATWVSSRL